MFLFAIKDIPYPDGTFQWKNLTSPWTLSSRVHLYMHAYQRMSMSPLSHVPTIAHVPAIEKSECI